MHRRDCLKALAKHGFSIMLPLVVLAMTIVSLAQQQAALGQQSLERRKEFLKRLIPLLTLERDEDGSDPRIWMERQSWKEWLETTGELPPDFDTMPADADLPNPLVVEKNGKEIPITTNEQWTKQRELLRGHIQHWLYGSMPPAPGNVRGTMLNSTKDGKTTVNEIELAFGPNHAAKLTIELIIPEGEGPFPVFMTQWNHRGWASIGVRRGYMACIYAGADSKDDTFYYRKLYPEHDFLVLARRAWGAMRCIDYLHTLPYVDKERIALAGHSRNGKQSLIAAAFDDRIKAVIPSSPGSGGEMPARFDRDNFCAGNMSLHVRLRRSWFHPRWRFFVGRENQLPVDSNSLVALVAPNACMLSTATNETEANNWAQEQVYKSAKTVYDFLGAGDKIALRFRGGGHSTSARDIEDYFDFFDYVFGRGDTEPPRTLYHDYSFDEWKRASRENIDPLDYPERGIDDLLRSSDGRKIDTLRQWMKKKPLMMERIRWSLGETPPGVTNPGPKEFAAAAQRPRADYISATIGRPSPRATMGKLTLSPYLSFGDYLRGDLYYPKEADEERPRGRLPVVIWLHPFSHNPGYGNGRYPPPAVALTKMGYAVFALDQIGFGTRVAEGANFYKRHPNWSLMGRMVTDVQAAVDALSNFDVIDPERIYCLGYSMGGTVALYAAATDDRIKGVVTVCGVSPFRLSNREKEKSHAIIKRYSHMHGLLPRLGFFVDDPKRIPFDMHETLALIAPRPVMVVAPQLDWDHPQADVVQCVGEVRKVYGLMNASDRIRLLANYDINRWSARYRDTPQKEVFDWISATFK
ncbi:MAG: alpha/beta fold hydrolase [Planctomycetes bacterium]|nr:alpha/beta fold hydrolase [Planctomycetota bacterium]